MGIDDSKVVDFLKGGEIGILPTDTIYGIVGSALNPQTVEKIYKLRKRGLDKPFIILISFINDLEKFDVELTDQQKKLLEKIWPNSVSVILPCKSEGFKYLHRGKKSLAFRMPKDRKLLKLLKQIGPLAAPSANTEGRKPAETIDEAKKYFGDEVSFYLNGGTIKSKPSTLVKLNKEGSWEILRQGSFRIPG